MSHGPISYVTVTVVKYRVGITGGVLFTVVDSWDYRDFRNEHEEVKPERAALESSKYPTPFVPHPLVAPAPLLGGPARAQRRSAPGLESSKPLPPPTYFFFKKK
jgi:hypothetical protein